ncbi:hypothetical protein E3E12_05655 [Formicincola oecophyllae]|uniref:DUF4412 domain-containing protein n=1 Tax=Formicincola oecophyllae TaxID=2558361 RepID=A0A4Y6UBB5_9PROT|nr:hypothetical protein [Formicincola oecophyllae]QDH13756.1 hypothetical protein E3E12_05655 [Formicincola oecophyllae]
MAVAPQAQAQVQPTPVAGSTVHPPLTPLHDVTVTYLFRAQHRPGEKDMGPEKPVTVSFGQTGDRVRIESAGAKGVTILDRPAQKVTLISNGERSYIQFLPLHGLRNPFMLDLNMQYKPGAMAKVAGVPCQQWAITSPQGHADACITADGVILSEHGVDADGIAGQLDATAVHYGPLPASLFEPPAGYKKVTPPQVGSTKAPSATNH